MKKQARIFICYTSAPKLENFCLVIVGLACYNIRNTRIPMQFSPSYVSQLEYLILDTLLPIYEKYQKSQGVYNPLKDINPEIISKVKAKKPIAALLKPRENYSCN